MALGRLLPTFLMPEKRTETQFSILRCPCLRHQGGLEIIGCLARDCHQHGRVYGSERGGFQFAALW